jgi:hypothetical protein
VIIGGGASKMRKGASSMAIFNGNCGESGDGGGGGVWCATFDFSMLSIYEIWERFRMHGE